MRLTYSILYPYGRTYLRNGRCCVFGERAQEFDEEEARKIQRKLLKNEFGFDDFLSQIQQVKNG
jgi:signal recognition particle GTPase